MLNSNNFLLRWKIKLGLVQSSPNLSSQRKLEYKMQHPPNSNQNTKINRFTAKPGKNYHLVPGKIRRKTESLETDPGSKIRWWGIESGEVKSGNVCLESCLPRRINAGSGGEWWLWWVLLRKELQIWKRSRAMSLSLRVHISLLSTPLTKLTFAGVIWRGAHPFFFPFHLFLQIFFILFLFFPFFIL